MTRAQELRKPHVYGNFKKPKTPGKRKNSSRRSKRAGMSADHLALIRRLPCCISLAMPGGEAHHLKAGTRERGMGIRSTDKWALPMSHDLHMEVEAVGTRRELKWFRDRGIDAHALAAALWANTGNLATMTKVLLAHISPRSATPSATAAAGRIHAVESEPHAVPAPPIGSAGTAPCDPQPRGSAAASVGAAVRDRGAKP